MKIVPWYAFQVHASPPCWWLRAFVKGITSDNKLMNLCEIGLLHIVWGVSKGTRDNYHEIWWKCFGAKMYQFLGLTGERHMVHLHFLFIIHKNGKSTRAWHILKSNSTLFWFNKFFPRMNNKKITKSGCQGQWAPLLFLYEVRIVVLIYFIAILLTPGIFLIQIVITNMYLIHFHSKNIKMNFPKSWVFKGSNPLQTFIIHCNAVK